MDNIKSAFGYPVPEIVSMILLLKLLLILVVKKCGASRPLRKVTYEPRYVCIVMAINRNPQNDVTVAIVMAIYRNQQNAQRIILPWKR